MLQRILNIVLYADAGKENYERVRPLIIESNRQNLLFFTGVATLIVAALYPLSYVFPLLESSREIYLFCISISSTLFMLVKFLSRRKAAYTYVTMYLLSAIILGAGIALGTLIEPTQASVSFGVLMFAVPLLFTDVPLRINLMTIISMVIYCKTAELTQDETMLTFNLSVIIPYGIISIVLVGFLMRMKVKSFVLQDKTAMMDKITSLNKEMQKARDEAEAANAAKTSFLFNMSHDIRTPMNAIIGFTNLLRKYQEEPVKRQEYLDKIEGSSAVLLSIINNVLEMARIEKGTVEIDESAWSAEQFNDTLYSVFHEMMRQKGLEFTREIDVQHPYVMCDATKLREVFINLLSNAYKYTNTGGKIQMLLKEVPGPDPAFAYYQTTIADTGIGMSKEFLPHLFEEFSRENNTTDNKIEGTGLGMPIVKRLIELMHGTIEVQSEKGVGTTFVVTIPHRITDRSQLVEHAGVVIDPKLFEGKRILLAEDNELNAEIAMEIMNESGFIVERAEDGQRCYEMLQQAPDNYYNVILMDIQMPNVNGYEATRLIRGMSDRAKSKIPILAMTANAFEEDKREATRAGMNGHLAKPINVSELMKTLAVVLA